MKKLLALIILPILFQGSLWSEFKEVPAYWDGKNFHQLNAQQIALSHPTLQESTLYFAVGVGGITCYGHGLLDGVLPLYVMLKEHDLLNTRLNLLIRAPISTQTNATFCNILQLLKDVFHFNQIIVINSGTAPLFIEKLIVHDSVPFSGIQPSSFSFYKTYPESYEYIKALQKLGFQENVVFQDTETQDNIVKDFVNFVLKAYNIDLPLVKNRVLLAFRPYSRQILNLDELSSALKNQGYQVAVVDFEKLSIKQQIIETIQSEYLMGTYGSNLVNAIFLKPEANVVVLWHKYAKYFWPRRYCIIHSAFLSTGVRLIEYDKFEYDERDVYQESIHVPEYFYRERKKMNRLRVSKLNMDDILKYPLPGMYEILNVDLYIDPNEIIYLLNHVK
ncbi:MAG: glycosyltransferase family 61 protein [Rhabdochlamydiaceae bacterium]|jgi:hypothetical protein